VLICAAIFRSFGPSFDSDLAWKLFLVFPIVVNVLSGLQAFRIAALAVRANPSDKLRGCSLGLETLGFLVGSLGVLMAFAGGPHAGPPVLVYALATQLAAITVVHVIVATLAWKSRGA
jgi:CBS domain containing-hemolysin-like protein